MGTLGSYCGIASLPNCSLAISQKGAMPQHSSRYELRARGPIFTSIRYIDRPADRISLSGIKGFAFSIANIPFLLPPCSFLRSRLDRHLLANGPSRPRSLRLFQPALFLPPRSPLKLAASRHRSSANDGCWVRRIGTSDLR